MCNASVICNHVPPSSDLYRSLPRGPGIGLSTVILSSRCPVSAVDMSGYLSIYLSLLVRSYMSITPGSANLEILIK